MFVSGEKKGELVEFEDSFKVLSKSGGCEGGNENQLNVVVAERGRVHLRVLHGSRKLGQQVPGSTKMSFLGRSVLEGCSSRSTIDHFSLINSRTSRQHHDFKTP